MFLFPSPFIRESDNPRQDGDENDRHDNHCKIISDNRYVSKKVAAENKNRYPQSGPRYAVKKKTSVWHSADSRHKWSKGPDDRDKSGNDDGFVAVAFIKSMGAFQIFFIEEAGFVFMENLGTGKASDPVIG